MNPPGDERALYFHQFRDTIRSVFEPELTSPRAIDAAGIVDRILVELIVEEEQGPKLTRSSVVSSSSSWALTPARIGLLWIPFAFTSSVSRPRTRSRVPRRAPTPTTRGLVRALVKTERGFLEARDASRNALTYTVNGVDALPVEECSVTKERLAMYLRGRLARSPHVVVEALSVVPGGRSKETILVSLSGTTELPHEVILRKDRPIGLLQTEAADEYAVIKAVHDYGGVPVPEPLFAERATEALGGGTFLVMECVGGHKAGEFFPDLAAPASWRREIGMHLAASLARLHSLPLERLSQTSLDPVRSVVTEEAVHGMVEGISTRIAEVTGPPCVTVPLARRWLLDHVSDVVPAFAAVPPAGRLRLSQHARRWRPGNRVGRLGSGNSRSAGAGVGGCVERDRRLDAVAGVRRRVRGRGRLAR